MVGAGSLKLLRSPHDRTWRSGTVRSHHLQYKQRTCIALPLVERRGSNLSASSSGRSTKPSRATTTYRKKHKYKQVARALFDPPPFEPEKLAVTFGPGAQTTGPPRDRRYTLTHNDITGNLRLTIDSEFNHPQISGFYTKLLRDEVKAEWYFTPDPSLHIYCHVSGEEKWLAPPAFRNYIFRREMQLVLDTFLYADEEMLERHPDLRSATVFVHFQSDIQELNLVECWGRFGDRSTWQPAPTSLMQRLLWSVLPGWKPQPGVERSFLNTDAGQTENGSGAEVVLQQAVSVGVDGPATSSAGLPSRPAAVAAAAAFDILESTDTSTQVYSVSITAAAVQETAATRDGGMQTWPDCSTSWDRCVDVSTAEESCYGDQQLSNQSVDSSDIVLAGVGTSLRTHALPHELPFVNYSVDGCSGNIQTTCTASQDLNEGREYGAAVVVIGDQTMHLSPVSSPALTKRIWIRQTAKR